jgi:hypothetical protein
MMTKPNSCLPVAASLAAFLATTSASAQTQTAGAPSVTGKEAAEEAPILIDALPHGDGTMKFITNHPSRHHSPYRVARFADSFLSRIGLGDSACLILRQRCPGMSPNGTVGGLRNGWGIRANGNICLSHIHCMNSYRLI